ncbi:hypothetical protein CRUP_010063 [Coryphaenoides rupestris]|nr:hypothetical protein CRUP_010063 [Coryphaenoides rupestris]
MSSGAGIAETPAAASPGGREEALSRADKQDTPYLPGMLPACSLTDAIPEWQDGDLHGPLLSGQDDTRPSAGQEDDPVPGLLEPRTGPHLTWLTANSLSELGLKHVGDFEQQHIMEDGSSARDLGQALLKATLPTEATGAPLRGGCRSPPWWGGLWGNDGIASPHRLSTLLSLSQANDVRAAHCSPLQVGTKASVARTTALFVQFSSWEWTAGEHAGPSSNTQQPADNGSLESPAPGSPRCSDALVPQREPSPGGSNVGAAVATVFSEVAVLTPDQDNGYSSLEEGHALCQPHTVQVIAEVELQVAGHIAIMETDTSEPTEWVSPAAEGMEKEGAGEGSCDAGGCEEEEEEEEDGGGADEASSATADVLTSPYCRNRAIAFIMGSPCSDDDFDDDDDADSLSDGEFSDDGFDSECSSEMSDSDSDDSDSDDGDPYNPLNFTAPMITGPKPIPSTSAAAATAAACSSDSSPDQGSPPTGSLSLTSSPPAVLHPDSPWDDSTSASEAEDADSLFLWNSFSSPLDPYSMQNFQAPVRTQRPLPEVQVAEGYQGKKRSLKASHRRGHQEAAASSPPQYQREGAEDRLDSGFSEPLAPAAPAAAVVPSQSCVVKKVRFCEEVEEFLTSSREEEDRRGQWEELARDRCRFGRRCQEVEQSIAYCLEPRHRTLVYCRLHS